MSKQASKASTSAMPDLFREPKNLSAKRTVVANLQNLWSDSDIYTQIYKALTLFGNADPVDGMPPNEVATDLANVVTVGTTPGAADFGIISVGTTKQLASFVIKLFDMDQMNSKATAPQPVQPAPLTSQPQQQPPNSPRPVHAPQSSLVLPVRYPATLAVLFAQYTVMHIDNLRADRADMIHPLLLAKAQRLINRAKTILHTSAVYSSVDQKAERYRMLRYLGKVFQLEPLDDHIKSMNDSKIIENNAFIEQVMTNPMFADVSMHMWTDKTRVEPEDADKSLYILKGIVDKDTDFTAATRLTIIASLYKTTTMAGNKIHKFATFTNESNVDDSVHFAVATESPDVAWLDKTVECLKRFKGLVMKVQGESASSFKLSYYPDGTDMNNMIHEQDHLIDTTTIHPAWLEVFVMFMAVRILYCADGISKNADMLADAAGKSDTTEALNAVAVEAATRKATLAYCRNTTRSLWDRIDEAYQMVKDPTKKGYANS